MEQNITSFLNTYCDQYGQLTFVSDSAGRTISYSQFHAGVIYAASGMEHIAEGTRFSIALPNCAEFLYLLFGGISKGGIAVNLNPHMVADEFRYRLGNAGVQVIFTTADVLQNISPVLDEMGITGVLISGDIPELMAGDHHARRHSSLSFHGSLVAPDGIPEPVSLSEDSIAFFQYTGGTTGTIKAAMISHRNVLASVRQMGDYLSERLRPADEVFMVTFPFYHVFSIVFQVLMAMRYGSTIVLYPVVRDLPVLARLMRETPFTVFVGVHTLYKWLLQDPVLSTMNYPAVKIFIAGAEHIQPETKVKWQQGTGHLIVEGYGLTETSALVSMSLLNPVNNDIDGIGMPLPETEIKLVSLNGEPIVEPGVEGEIWVRGPQVVKGYYNSPVDNVNTFVDGWLKTGDMAIKKPNGQYKLVGRKKDMINVSGFNVYPSEVESVLMSVPGVVDCAVTGVPDQRSGERVAAFVVSRTPVTEEEIIAHCQAHMSAYKVPILVRFLEVIPKSAVGKTLRRELAGLV